MTFRVKSDVPLTTASRAEIRFLNLVGDRYLALEAGRRTPDADGRSSRRRHHPGRPDQAGARPDHALQRLPAAVPGARPRAGQRAEHEPGAGAAGRGRHRPGAARRRPRRSPTRLADRDQLIGEVVDNLSQTLDTVDSRHQQLNDLVIELQGLDGRPGPRPQHDRRLARQHLRPDRRGRRPAPPGPAAAQVRRRQAARSWPRCSTSRRTSSRSSSCSTGCPSR